MTILLVEKDETHARLLTQVLVEYFPVSIIEQCGSREALKTKLNEGILPDLAICEVEFFDGLVFELFQEIPPIFPIIFMSAYDKYWSQAMGFNAIDYLRKPIEKEDRKSVV